MTSKKDETKTVDITPQYTFAEAYANTIAEAVVKAIAKRPPYKRMLTEALTEVVIDKLDENGKVVKDDNDKPVRVTVYKYSDNLQHVTLCNLIVKGMVSAMNDLNANKIIVPSLDGKAVVCKNPIQAGITYENVYQTYEENGFSYAVIDFSVTNGCITKESLLGFDGYRFGDMVLSVIGKTQLKQLVVNASTTVTEMSEELVAFMDKYVPCDITGQLIKSALASKSLTGKDYTDAISQYGRMIKSDARKAEVITMAEHKSRVLSLLVENKLKATYPKAEKTEEAEETKEAEVIEEIADN